MTYSTANVQNVQLGACSATYLTQSLGLTKGGIKVAFATQKKSVTVDQFGQTILNDYIMGRTGTVTIPMAESDLAKLQAVIVGSTLIIDHTTPTKTRLVVPTAIGTSLIASAGMLNLHPIGNAATDYSQDVNIPLAAPTGQMTFEYQFENERIYNVEFQMYPNISTGLLFTIGDLTASAT